MSTPDKVVTGFLIFVSVLAFIEWWAISHLLDDRHALRSKEEDYVSLVKEKEATISDLQGKLSDQRDQMAGLDDRNEALVLRVEEGDRALIPLMAELTKTTNRLKELEPPAPVQPEPTPEVEPLPEVTVDESEPTPLGDEVSQTVEMTSESRRRQPRGRKSIAK